MDKTVAIKVLHPSLAVDDDVVPGFQRGASCVAHLASARV